MATAQQAARITDPITHGLGLIGIAGGMLVGAVAGVILIAALPVTAPALLVGLTAAAAVGAVAGGGLAGHQLLAGIQRACALPSPTTGMVGAVGSPNVRIGNLPAARVVSDVATSCNGLYALSHLPIPPLPQAQIAEGAHTIRINGLLAARVSSKLTCGASIQRGALTVYFGGPTERVLAVFDLESLLLSGLGFVAKASLIAMSLLTIPLGVGAMATFAVVFGGFAAVNYGLGRLGNQIGPGWGDILQGGFGLAAILGGSVLGAKALGKSEPAIEPAELNSDSFSSYARPSEQATAERLAESHREFDGEIFEAAPAPDPGYDWTDSSGRTYDAMGDGTKSKYFDLDQFTDSIDHHLLKGNDFTVIDMTGYSPEQAAAVRDYVDSLPPEAQANIRRLGF